MMEATTCRVLLQTFFFTKTNLQSKPSINSLLLPFVITALCRHRSELCSLKVPELSLHHILSLHTFHLDISSMHTKNFYKPLPGKMFKINPAVLHSLLLHHKILQHCLYSNSTLAWHYFIIYLYAFEKRNYSDVRKYYRWFTYIYTCIV